MTALTDPARELADACERLSAASDKRGDEHLAEMFSVPSWSTEFFQIVFCLSERADFLKEIVGNLELDDDYKKEAVRHIGQLKKAFGRDSLLNIWKQKGATFLSPQNIQPIKMLSPQVRKDIYYPKLSEEEIGELISLVSELEKWLLGHQLVEQDFIRQAILDGIAQFRFRLERVGWLGWGYTVASLRDVIGAYMALERGTVSTRSPDAEAMLKKVSSGLKKIYEKIGLAKDVVDMGEFLLKAYGATTLIIQGTTIVGLIGHNG